MAKRLSSCTDSEAVAQRCSWQLNSGSGVGIVGQQDVPVLTAILDLFNLSVFTDVLDMFKSLLTNAKVNLNTFHFTKLNNHCLTHEFICWLHGSQVVLLWEKWLTAAELRMLRKSSV